jgi:hypothetical protein
MLIMGAPPDFCKAEDLDVFCLELLVAKPKTLPVVNQDLQGRGRAVAEDEHPAVEGVVPQRVFAQPGQSVNAAAKIGWLDRGHHPHLWRDLNHRC